MMNLYEGRGMTLNLNVNLRIPRIKPHLNSQRHSTMVEFVEV